MSKLGSVEIKVPRGKPIIAIAAIGPGGEIARAYTILFRPGEDDWIQVEFVVIEPKDSEVKK